MNIPTSVVALGTKIVKRKKTAIFVVLLASVSGYYIHKTWFTPVAPPSYVVENVQRGTVATSVTGSGQVWGESQIVVKPEVSGKILTVAVKDGDVVAEGDVLVTVKNTDAQKALRDAEIGYRSASLSLEKLEADASAVSRLQAEDGLAQAQRALESLTNPSASDITTATDTVNSAQRDLDAANRNLTLAQANTTQDLDNAYNDGYSSVTSTFIQLPTVMSDLGDVLGTETSSQEYVDYYKLLASDTEAQKVLTSIQTAQDSYAATYALFEASNYSSDTDTKVALIDATLATAKLVGNALQESGMMYGTIADRGYSTSSIASVIRTMTATVAADTSKITSAITSLQSATDTITTTNTTSPKTLADAEDAVTKAEETLAQKKTALTTLQSPTANDVAKATEDVREKQAALDDLNSGADTFDLRSAQLTLEQRANAVTDAQDTLAKYSILAPISGVVANFTAVKGDTANTGTAIATVVSQNQTVSIALNEIDAAKIVVGQHAVMTFDAIDGLSVTGAVSSINSLGAVSQGVVTYTITLMFDTQDDRINPGMSANVTIMTDERQDVLFVPNSAVQSRHGKDVVEMFVPALVVRGNQGTVSSALPTFHDVVTGLSNDVSTEIVSGVNEGDQIVTKTISASLTTKTAATSSLFGGGGSGRTLGQ